MGLLIVKTDGFHNFDVYQVEEAIEQMTWGNEDSIDLNVGFEENNLLHINGMDCVPVVYSRSNTGSTPERLDDLVNGIGSNFICIFAVDNTWILNDGRSVANTAYTLPASDSFSNPFYPNYVSIFYDSTACPGNGIQVVQEGGGTTQMCTSVLLYHELSHALHHVKGTVASGNQEEVNARTDENDMRDVCHLDHCDVNSQSRTAAGGPETCHHGGGTPCPCIIASIATGSPYSSEVNRLRHFREHTLRGSEVGDDFFEQFHYHYYEFSPEVCRLMVQKPRLALLVKRYFVIPLVAGLELLAYYADNEGHGLIGLLRQQAKRDEFEGIYCQEFLDEFAAFLRFVGGYDKAAISTALSSKGEDFAGVADLLQYANKQTVKDIYINWSLVGVLRIWLSSASLLTAEKTDGEINTEINILISGWIDHLPITSIWGEFSRLQIEKELHSLDHFMFDHQAKRIFSRRLIRKYPEHSTIINHWARNRRRETCSKRKKLN